MVGPLFVRGRCADLRPAVGGERFGQAIEMFGRGQSSVRGCNVEVIATTRKEYVWPTIARPRRAFATLFGETYTYDQANALAGKWFH